MAIANSYFNSSPITDSDIFVGTKYATNRTVNYTAQSIADYLNVNARISISGQLTFKFTILPNVAKTIAFENGGGDGRLFSSIDKLIVSILDAGGSNITVFLDYLVDGEILLAEQNQPNSFGHYKITSYTVTANPNFYELNLEYIGGNGNIYKDVYYDMTPWASSGGSGTTPTLQQVTTAGAITTDAIQVGGITAGNFVADGFSVGISDSYDSNYNFLYTPFGSGLYIGDGLGNGTTIYPDSSIGFTTAVGFSNLMVDLLTSGKTWQLPDANGTLALNTDIPTATSQLTNDGEDGVNPFITLADIPPSTGIESVTGTTVNNTDPLNPVVNVPTLQQVTTAGSTTTDLILLENIAVSANSLILSNNFVGLLNTSTGKQVSISIDDGIAFIGTGGSISLKSPTTISGTNTQTFQNASGTIALTSDITIPTLQQILDNNRNLVNGNFFAGTDSGAPNTGTNVIAIGNKAGSDNIFKHVYMFGDGAIAKDNNEAVFSKYSLEASPEKSLARFSFSNISADRKYTLPDATGTIALTSDIPSGSGIQHATASGTDTYTATITGVTSYADADAYLIRFTNGNTTGATLNINSLGARPLYRNNDGPLLGGDVGAGGEMLCVYNSTTNVFQCIGTSPNSLFAYVTNDDSVTITKGMPVYAFGGTGDRMTVKRANNTGDATSAQTVGLVLSTSIAPNQKGFILMQGLLDGLSILPTATWSDGDAVYLGATAGTITNVKPYAPNHLVYLGTVTTASNGAAGRLYVRVQNGFELQELHNVDLISNAPTNNQLLTYESATSLWKNKNLIDILETFNRTQGIYYFEEFMGNQGGGITTSFSNVISINSGTAASCITTGTINNRTNQQGVARAQTGTTAAGQAGYIYGVNFLRGFSTVSIETYANVETLSTATERFFTFFGNISAGTSYQNPANGIFFAYDEGGSIGFTGTGSPNWRCVSINSLTRTFSNSSVPVVAGQWYKLRIDINAAGTQASFFIDGNFIVTLNTNIPATTTPMGVHSVIVKTIGLTARAMQTDYFMYEEIFTNPR
jgi:hypothetical protein